MTRLSIGCTFSDRIEALLDGRVTIPGHDIDLRVVEAQALFRSVLQSAAFDVAELSMASHIAAVAAGRDAYVGLPAFLSRSFRHANLYVRTDRGISSPADLAGRTIGLVDYQQTAAMWVRGMLADDHGVARESVRWVAAGLHVPVLQDRAPTVLPSDIRLERSDGTLDALLAKGTVDAVISPGAPRCFLDGSAPVARAWRDPRASALEYWQRTRLFPIMHLLVVRRSLIEAEPELPSLLYAAFETAHRLAVSDLSARDFPKVAVPWLSDHVTEAKAALGGDPWTYGLEANRHVLEVMLRYAEADGLTDGRLDPEALFV